MTAYIFSGHGLCRQASSCCQPSCRRIKYLQSGIGVRAIRRTARIAPANAAAPTTASIFCWAASSLLCKSVRHKSRRQLQQQARCPAFPITKTAHIGFSCVHHFPSCSSQNRCFSKSVRIPRTAHRRFCVPYPCTGSSTAIVVPFFELSSTRTQPPWRLAISHTKESPSPTPPYSRLRDLSTRKKG